MYCRKCGKEIPNGASFCPYCAAPTAQGSAGSSTAAPSSNTGRTQQPKKMPLLLRIIIVVVVFSVASVIGENMAKPKKEKSKDPVISEASMDHLTDTVSGQWVMAPEDDVFEGCYIYKLNTSIANCKGFSVDYEAKIEEGPSCDVWNVYVRSFGEWVQADTLYLSSGKASKSIDLGETLTIDAIMVHPDSNDRSLLWRDELRVYDPVRGSASEALKNEDSSSEGRWVSGSWTAETYHVNDTNTSAFKLDTPIQNCRKLKIAMNVEMMHNTSCSDWAVYAKQGASWKKIGNIYLPGGDGETEAVVQLSSPMTVSEIVVIPKIAGNYSWNFSIAVCDMN